MLEEAQVYVGFAILLLIAGGCVLAGIAAGIPAAHWFGKKVADFLSFQPMEEFDKAQPAYGIASSKAMCGDLDGAMEFYEQLLLDHPREMEIYVRMLEITLGPMGGTAYAEDIMSRAMAALKVESDRVAIAKIFGMLRNGELRPFKHLGLQSADTQQPVSHASH